MTAKPPLKENPGPPLKQRYFSYEDAVSLRDYFESRLEALERLIDTKIEANKDAMIEARRGMENRMEGFPTQFAKKDELAMTAETVKKLKDEDLRDLKDRDLKEIKDQFAKFITKTEGIALAGFMIAVMGLIFTAFQIWGKRGSK